MFFTSAKKVRKSMHVATKQAPFVINQSKIEEQEEVRREEFSNLPKATLFANNHLESVQVKQCASHCTR